MAGEQRTDPKLFEGDADLRVLLPGADHAPQIVLRRVDGVATANIPHRYVYHSPTGFEWGYGGSGPADLALNVLGCFVPPAEAMRLHQQFKWDFISPMPHEGGVIEPERVLEWIRAQWKGKAKRVRS